MKDVEGIGDTVVEFQNEGVMLDKFMCDLDFDINYTWFIRNIIMTTTEFAPCKSLGDCNKEQSEPPRSFTVMNMLDATK